LEKYKIYRYQAVKQKEQSKLERQKTRLYQMLELFKVIALQSYTPKNCFKAGRRSTHNVNNKPTP